MIGAVYAIIAVMMEDRNRKRKFHDEDQQRKSSWDANQCQRSPGPPPPLGVKPPGPPPVPPPPSGTKPPGPPPTSLTHIKSSSSSKPLAIKLGAAAKSKPEPEKKPPKSAKKPAMNVAAVFGQDSDSDDEEEMPAEARMRMKNIGRDTITSSGPNSFGKTKLGFIDSKSLFERQLKEKMDKVSGDS